MSLNRNLRMKKIDWTKDIVGADGISRDKEKIEKFFTGLFEKPIKTNLTNWKEEELKDGRDQDDALLIYLNEIIENLHDILLASPEELRIKSEEFKNKIKHFLESGKTTKEVLEFRKRLKKEFNYEGFRKALLNQLAVVLNVKTCLYCNQQYTLAFGKSPNKRGDISLRGSTAFLQFDHFYGKSEFPILSMSLYNLVPSCPICNQKKSKRHVSLKLHPYVNDLSSMMRFRIKNIDAFINPAKKGLDLLEVEIDTDGDQELTEFVNSLELQKRYSRHLDIVQELEVALYLSEYYNTNFKAIESILSSGTHSADEKEKALNRHIKGFYADTDDINKRPLTKFCQDIYNQLSDLRESERLK